MICGLTSLQEKKFFCLAPDAAFFCFSARKNQIGQQVTCFCIASILGGFDFPYRGNEEKLHQERTQGFSAAAPGILRCRSGRRLDCVPLAHGAPFFLQKGPSCEISPRDISQFTPENAPYGKSTRGVPLSAESGQGLLAPGPSAGSPRWQSAFIANANNNLVPRGYCSCESCLLFPVGIPS